jgi:hypothetical protein
MKAIIALLVLATTLLISSCGVTTENEPEELPYSPATTATPPTVTQSPEPSPTPSAPASEHDAQPRGTLENVR